MHTYTMTEQDRAGVTRDYEWAVEYGIVFNGLPASDDLANINGVHIQFFIHEDTPKPVIEEAKKDARRKRDVVGFSCMIVPKGFPNDQGGKHGRTSP